MQNLGSNLIGSSLAPIVLVAIAKAYHWRTAFYIAAIPGLICAFLCWKIVREPIRTPSVAAVEVPAEHDEQDVGALQMFRYRNIVLCAVMCCFMVAWMVLGWVFLPVVYANYLHIPSPQASLLMALLGISAAVFAFIVPGLSDKLGTQARGGRVLAHRRAVSARRSVLHGLAARARHHHLHRLVGERRVPDLHGHDPVRDDPGEVRRDFAGAHRGCG